MHVGNVVLAMAINSLLLLITENNLYGLQHALFLACLIQNLGFIVSLCLCIFQIIHE